MDVDKFAELLFNKDKREEFIKEVQELLGDEGSSKNDEEKE